MADITLEIGGNSSGAVDALNEAGGAASSTGDEVGKSVVKWQELTNIMKGAASAAVKFGVDAVKAWAETERAQRQLTRVAGEHTEALNEQAQAMSKLFAVDDDIITQSQTLLTTWGGVGAASKETTKTILDYAAATGQDAVSATQDLIRNVESGGVGLAKMGIQIEATGDRGKDLALVVQALNEKFGGAGGADAASLNGQLRNAEIAFDDVKKSIGGSIASFLEQTGAVAKLTSALRNLNEFIGGDEANRMHKEGLQAFDMGLAKRNVAEAEQQLNEAMLEGQSDTIIALFSTDVDNARAKLAELEAAAKGLVLPGVTGTTNFGVKNAKEFKTVQTPYEDLAAENMTRKVGIAEEESARLAKIAEDEAKELLKIEAEMHAESAKLQKEADEADEKSMRDSFKVARKIEEDEMKARLAAEEESAKSIAALHKKSEEDARSAADAIGGAFVGALTDQLARLAEGEELDPAMFVAEILAATVSAAATIIGSVYGQPALGAAIGNLAAMGIRAGGSAISKKSKKYHDGGWVEPEPIPRHHAGAWIGSDERQAILQTRERVLSRQEVAAMGGRDSVDSMARGSGGARGGVIVNVTALDAKSAAEAFSSQVGAGLRRALEVGRGDMPHFLAPIGGAR